MSNNKCLTFAFEIRIVLYNEMSSKLKMDAYAFMGISIWSVPMLFLHIQLHIFLYK